MTDRRPVVTGRPPRVAVVGSLNLDLVCGVDRLPEPGETVAAGPLRRFPGGKGGNQAVALARLGTATEMVGCVGDDDAGRLLLAALRDEGVDVSGVRAAAAPTGAAMILVDAAGQNQIAVSAGANAQVTVDGVDLTRPDAVLCQLEIPLDVVVEAASGASGFFCLNAAPARALPAELVERADLVVVNETEHGAISGLDRCRLVAVTLGPGGAVLLERGAEVARVAAPEVEAVDTVAAGDAFCAALVAGLVAGAPQAEALCRACVAGAITVTRPGAQSSLPSAAEIEMWLRSGKTAF